MAAMTQDRRKNEQDLIMLLNSVSRGYRKVVNRVLAAHGLSDSQALPILFISRSGDGIRAGALAEQVWVEAPSLVRQLDQLCAAGLVERREDPSDRRAKALHLTATGRAQAVLIEALFQNVRSRMLSPVGDDDLLTALKALRGFEEAIAGGSPDRG